MRVRLDCATRRTRRNCRSHNVFESCSSLTICVLRTTADSRTHETHETHERADVRGRARPCCGDHSLDMRGRAPLTPRGYCRTVHAHTNKRGVLLDAIVGRSESGHECARVHARCRCRLASCHLNEQTKIIKPADSGEIEWRAISTGGGTGMLLGTMRATRVYIMSRWCGRGQRLDKICCSLRYATFLIRQNMYL